MVQSTDNFLGDLGHEKPHLVESPLTHGLFTGCYAVCRWTMTWFGSDWGDRLLLCECRIPSASVQYPFHCTSYTTWRCQLAMARRPPQKSPDFSPLHRPPQVVQLLLQHWLHWLYTDCWQAEVHEGFEQVLQARQLMSMTRAEIEQDRVDITVVCDVPAVVLTDCEVLLWCASCSFYKTTSVGVLAAKSDWATYSEVPLIEQLGLPLRRRVDRRSHTWMRISSCLTCWKNGNCYSMYRFHCFKRCGLPSIHIYNISHLAEGFKAESWLTPLPLCKEYIHTYFPLFAYLNKPITTYAICHSLIKFTSWCLNIH